MKKLLLIIFLAVLILPVAVYASDVTDADYYGTISTTNAGAAITAGVSSNISGISTPSWVTAGILNSSANNCVMQSGGSDVTFMPGYDTNSWIMYYETLPAEASTTSAIYTGDVTGGDIVWFPDPTADPSGSILDNASLELGANYTLEYYGLFDSSTFANFCVKTDAILIDISAADTIRVYNYGGGGHDLTAPYVSSGSKQKIEIYQNAASSNMTIEVDDVIIGSLDVSSTAIPNNANDWKILGRDAGYHTAAIYLEYFKIYVGGQLRAYYYWEYGSTFADHGDDATSCTMTPSFRTTTSDADVTSSLISFSPVDEAEASGPVTGEWPELFEEVPEESDYAYTENSTPGIIGAGVIHALAVGSGHTEVESFIWFNLTFLISILASMIAFRLHQSLLLKAIVLGAFILFWSLPGMNVYGVFVFFYFILFAFGLVVLGRSYGW